MRQPAEMIAKIVGYSAPGNLCTSHGQTICRQYALFGVADLLQEPLNRHILIDNLRGHELSSGSLACANFLHNRHTTKR
jgi:hypothetical protein